MRIQIGGRAVGVDDTGGAGIPVLLVHGFPLDRTIWSAQVRGLADVARVIAPDLRGFGESDPAPGDGATTMDDYAADVAGLLDALGIPTAVVGGVSMGGYVAMAFQRRFARRLRGLVFVDTRAGPDSPEARASRDGTAALARDRGAPAVASGMIEKMLTPATARGNEPMARSLRDLIGAQSVPGIVGALGAIRDRPDSTPDLPRIAVPVLVVCGAGDALIPPAESEAIRSAVPGARLAIIPGAAHLPNLERPGEFNRALRGFLEALPAA